MFMYPRTGPTGPVHDDRAVPVLNHLGADGARQQALEATGAAGSHNDHVGVHCRLQQFLGRGTEDARTETIGVDSQSGKPLIARKTARSAGPTRPLLAIRADTKKRTSPAPATQAS